MINSFNFLSHIDPQKHESVTSSNIHFINITFMLMFYCDNKYFYFNIKQNTKHFIFFIKEVGNAISAQSLGLVKQKPCDIL